MRVEILAVVLSYFVTGLTSTRAQDKVAPEVPQSSKLAATIAEYFGPATVISNRDGFAEQLARRAVFYLPDGASWDTHLLDYQPVWLTADCSWLKELQALARIGKNPCLMGATYYGLAPYRCKLTLELLTGELVIRPECATDELVRFKPPADYQPGQWPKGCVAVERLWATWLKIQAEPDWQEMYGKGAAPTLTMHLLVGSFADDKPV